VFVVRIFMISALTSRSGVDVAGARALEDVHTLLQTVCPVILRQPRPSARKVFGLTGLED
jgi:anti-anti-sigma regulatory factor